ncbi:mercury methylation corrinoid protein HgcA [Methanococcoides sp. FTZ1]|uniref:mercury methylation corrinoid protein HgcA n=1 Tax=Methanococcoides sp. FTZ1 TaxID=3439061 RepID=UPI003F877776
MNNDRDTGSCCSSDSGTDTSCFITMVDLDRNISPPEIRKTASVITFSDRFDHFLGRCGVKREEHIVSPGIYKLGNPTPDSSVFVSANYTLSFDALRSSLAGIDCYILVIDTKGINVWCAAGKGTFGTDEIIYRIKWSGLDKIINHRNLILPQLSAPGVSAHAVKRRSGFKVEYGPVRAEDLPQYLRTHTATAEMRRVRFTFMDRLVLTPVELVHVIKPTLLAAIILYLLVGPFAVLIAVVTAFTGTVLFPVLLPFIPTHDLSTKGLILGGIVTIPFAFVVATNSMINSAMSPLENILAALSAFLIPTAVIAYLALNFTGCTTYTSRTGVKKEIFRYVPFMAIMGGMGLLFLIILFITLMEVI